MTLKSAPSAAVGVAKLARVGNMVVGRKFGYLGSSQLLLELRNFLDVLLEESLRRQRAENNVNTRTAQVIRIYKVLSQQ